LNRLGGHKLIELSCIRCYRESLKFADRIELMFFGWMSVSQDHLDSAMAEQGRESHQIYPGHDGSSGKSMAEVIKTESSDAATSKSAGVCLLDRSARY